MGPRAVLDAVVKRKIPSPRREGVDWIHLTQDRDMWRTVENTGFIKGG
jgi:hypothetical protein